MVTKAKRKLTQKQKLYFGTKRQRGAIEAALDRKRSKSRKKIVSKTRKVTRSSVKHTTGGSTNWLVTALAGLGGLAAGGVGGVILSDPIKNTLSAIGNKLETSLGIKPLASPVAQAIAGTSTPQLDTTYSDVLASNQSWQSANPVEWSNIQDPLSLVNQQYGGW